MRFLIKSKKVDRVLCIVLFLCFFIASCNNTQAEGIMSADPGAGQAPDFTLQDIKGEDIGLNDFAGEKGIFIVFTTTWCPHCITVIPDLKNIYADIQTRNIEMLAVYIREPRDKVKAFREKHALPYPVLLDLDGAVASLYKIRGVPSFVLVDKAGSIKYIGHSIPATLIKEIGK